MQSTIATRNEAMASNINMMESPMQRKRSAIRLHTIPMIGGSMRGIGLEVGDYKGLLVCFAASVHNRSELS
ncbi:hypothetical protein BT69DRAFT_1289426 [Atractiella rhizophila]|nr:hypothetical protein BT69DRAFT_1289426 [Atractiella rhizophila]